MTQNKRIAIGVLALVILTGAVLGIDALRRSNNNSESGVEPGEIPIYVDGELLASFSPDDLEQLESAGFVDAEEGKTQEGWMLRDVLLIHLESEQLQPETSVKVSSSSRNKSIALTWAEVDNVSNMVMFDLSGRGTLKLVSEKIPRFDIRDEWVQDVDKIEVNGP